MIPADDSAQHLTDAPPRRGDVKVFPAPPRSSSSGTSPFRLIEDGPRPADLVTPEDLKRVLGIDVGPPAAFDADLPAPSWLSVRSCSYRSGDGVRVDVHAAAGMHSRYLMVLGHIVTRVQGRPIQGIGGGAMLYPGLVAARSGRGTFVISVSALTGPPPSDPLIDLARTAAARLAETRSTRPRTV
ncbi:hypothetical protein [Sphaerimonospora thailandensis]|uniref:Uncharacterized protein n=1 Tax=Sphaerimonospora thailandensis TaxID=795644 RepID=A0A8J3R9A0_9ACTN|nr:hypothetical protein [Sphaerimonospora thailandensis]GIH71741.1 hypothetical protein Mth01_39940 [Sphaerimonospora thailandensis]